VGKLVAHRAQSMRGPLLHSDSFSLGAPAAGGGGGASDAAAGGASAGGHNGLHHSHGHGHAGGRKASAGEAGPAGRSLLGSVGSVLDGGGSLPDVHSFVAKHSRVGDDEDDDDGALHGAHLSDGSGASSARLQYAALLGAQGMGIQTARSAQSGYGPSAASAYGSGPYGEPPGVGKIGQPDFSMPRLIAMGAAAGGRLPGSPGYAGVAPTSRSGGDDSVGGGMGGMGDMAAFGAGADDSLLPSRLSKLDLYYRPVKDAERMVVVIPGPGAGSGAPSPAATHHYMVPLSASSSSGAATPVDGAAAGAFRSPPARGRLPAAAAAAATERGSHGPWRRRSGYLRQRGRGRWHAPATGVARGRCRLPRGRGRDPLAPHHDWRLPRAPGGRGRQHVCPPLLVWRRCRTPCFPGHVPRDLRRRPHEPRAARAAPQARRPRGQAGAPDV
jgi:hypothetical protein